jgi:hypothetical protein
MSNDPGYVIINGRRYPSNYPPGKHWAIDRAWEILDTLPKDTMSDENRAWLAGVFAGALMKAGNES